MPLQRRRWWCPWCGLPAQRGLCSRCREALRLASRPGDLDRVRHADLDAPWRRVRVRLLGCLAAARLPLFAAVRPRTPRQAAVGEYRTPAGRYEV